MQDTASSAARARDGTEDFYRGLPAVPSFAGVYDLANYAPLPGDWHVIVADVSGSTDAVRAGSYKAVNLAGVSVIAAILNLARDVEIPYIFGGDGASLCVPDRLSTAARAALLATRGLVRDQYGLDLRVGIIPVGDLYAAGCQLLVAKQRISRWCVQAAFTGDGIEHAETLLKSGDLDAAAAGDPGGAGAGADYSGLECRWDDVPSPRGETISLIVKCLLSSLAGQVRFYEEVVARIEDIYGDDQACRPVSVAGLRPAHDAGKLSLEALLKSYRRGRLAYARMWLLLRVQNLLGLIFMRYRLKLGGVDWGEYKPDLVANTDFRKFDGVLRLVISGTPDARQSLDAWLEQQYRQRRCVYGIHSSGSALVTCLVGSRNGNHYHFVDGAGGGYAMAAAALKERLRTLPATGGAD